MPMDMTAQAVPLFWSAVGLFVLSAVAILLSIEKHDWRNGFLGRMWLEGVDGLIARLEVPEAALIDVAMAAIEEARRLVSDCARWLRRVTHHA